MTLNSIQVRCSRCGKSVGQRYAPEGREKTVAENMLKDRQGWDACDCGSKYDRQLTCYWKPVGPPRHTMGAVKVCMLLVAMFITWPYCMTTIMYSAFIFARDDDSTPSQRVLVVAIAVLFCLLVLSLWLYVGYLIIWR